MGDGGEHVKEKENGLRAGRNAFLSAAHPSHLGVLHKGDKGLFVAAAIVVKLILAVRKVADCGVARDL